MTARFTDHFLNGDHASLPDPATVPVGALYACVTDSKIHQSTGTAWGDWLTEPSGGLNEAAIVALVNDDTTPSPLRAALDLIYTGGGLDESEIVALINDDTTPSSLRAALDALYSGGGGGGLNDAGVAALINDGTTPSATRAALDTLYSGGGGGSVPAPITVANEAAMLASGAVVGQTAIRSDILRTFQLAALPASTLANWTMLLTVGTSGPREPKLDQLEIGTGAKVTAMDTQGLGAIAIGQNAGGANGISLRTIAIGYNAMTSATAGSATGCIALGAEALKAVTTGGTNIGIGYQALRAITTVADNIGIGYQAGAGAFGNNPGARGIQIGTGTSIYGNATDCIVIGHSLAHTNKNDTIVLGSASASTAVSQAHIGPRHYAADKMVTAPTSIGASTGGIFWLDDGSGNLLLKTVMDTKTVTLASELGVTYDPPISTASRPSASAVGAGATYFDTTLGKPVWSNGTAWVDATGATV